MRHALQRDTWIAYARVGGAIALVAGTAFAQSKTYTFDSDFDEGVLINVNHDLPNSDQLQLNETAEPLPFVYIAASGRGTVCRIDVNTGAVLGEYLTSPDGMGRNPSRTTVDQLGNVWVANRAEAGAQCPPGAPVSKGSVTRIGVVIGGTRVDSDGTPNANGDYLMPPFTYNTCADRDGDGLIKTSRGLADIRPWTNAGLADVCGGVSTADDECIINFTRVTGTGTRTVAVDSNNDVWVGGFTNREHEKLDGVSGNPVPGSQFNVNCGGYGGFVDGNGVLWSAGQLETGTLRYETDTLLDTCISGLGNYGLGLDPNTGDIWQSSLSCCANALYQLTPAGAFVSSHGQPFGNAQGVAVDGNSHVWVAQLFGSQVGHWAPDPNNPATYLFVGSVPGFSGTTGVAVDSNGKIWASDQGIGARRVDPAAGAAGGGGLSIGAIDLTVNLGPGAAPYNYSDMTGFVVLGGTSNQGTWSVVFDSLLPGSSWGTASWTSSEPAGSNIGVQVRAADNVLSLPGEAFVPVGNGVPFRGLAGQFIEISTTFELGTAVSSPVLFDLTIEGCNSSTYCTGGTNSDGEQASISSTGSTSVADNTFGLVTDGVASASRFGLYVMSANQADVPFQQGTICVALDDTFARLAPIQTFSSVDQVSRAVDLTAPPTDVILGGSTWYFQFWYRDFGLTNLSNAICVCFGP